MHKVIDQGTQEQLEALVDYHSLESVLSALSEICALKSEHVAVHWQDTITAKAWMRASDTLDKTASHTNVRIVS